MVSNFSDNVGSRPSPKASSQQFLTASIDTDPLFPTVGSVWDSENRCSRSGDRGEISFASPKSSPTKSFKVGSPAISKLLFHGGNVPMSRRGCSSIHSKQSDTDTVIHPVQVNSTMTGASKHIPAVKSNSTKDLAYDYVFLHGQHVTIERKGSKRLSSSSIQAVDRFASRGHPPDTLCDYDSTILTVAIVMISIAILACWSFAILVMGPGR